MTEAEWLACADPTPLLLYLRDRGEARRFWLFASACCRRFPELIATEAGQRLVEAVEAYADGALTYFAVQCAVSALRQFLRSDVPCSIVYLNSNLVSAFRGPAAWAVAWKTDDYACRVVRVTDRGQREENRARSDLVRDIFGNPFRTRPGVDPAWLNRNDDAVGSIARWIYEDRRFEYMPILFDALLDAGCDNEELLAHCRSAGPHVRGCWAVDLILGKS